MTGLEKIIQDIQSEANEKAERIISEAEKTAKEILDTARETAVEKEAEIAQKSMRDCEDFLKRSESANMLEAKKRILMKKQELINDTIDLAYKKLCTLNDAEYFDVIVKMLERFALDKDGSIIFSERDKGRLPSDFEKLMNEKLTAKYAVSEKTADIDGGFILVYGGIEENCSFRALFDSSREMLSDMVHNLLFE